MRLENYSVKKLNRQIIEILNGYIDLDKYKIFYFGSRVSGKGDERSDIDVGVEGEQSIPPEKIINIKEQLETLPTLYKVDIVDFTKVSNDFKKMALTNIEKING